MDNVERKVIKHANFLMVTKKSETRKVNVWPNVQMGKAMMLMTKTKKESVKRVRGPHQMGPISKANVKQNHYAQHPNAYKMETVLTFQMGVVERKLMDNVKPF